MSHFLSYSSIAIYPYFAARSSAARVFRAKHHQGHPHFPRYPPHASSHAASHHRGPARITLQLSRGETESLVATSRRHLQDPTLHYAFPHTCSCHQHVTAWTSTRLSWHEYIDDIWSVTSGCRSARTPVFVRFASVRVLEASVIFRKAFDLPPHSFLPLEHFHSYGNWQQTTTHIAT